jgi:putative ABC transport system permease protein
LSRAAGGRSHLRGLLDDAWRDTQFALRSFRREPSVAAGIVVTFALAIGANAAMVGLVTSLMFSVLPGVVDADAVARLRIEVTTSDGDRYAMSTTSYPVFQAAQARRDAFSAVAASEAERLTIGQGVETTEGAVIAASGDYFRLLGVHPAMGRFFGVDDDAPPSGSAVAVLSHPYWQRRFGGAQDVLGSHIVVDGIDYTIVGVAPRGFTGDGVAPVDLFVPLTVSQRKSAAGWMSNRGIHFISVIVRVRDRAAVPQALGTITGQLRADAGDEQVLAVQLESLDKDLGVSPRQLEIARWLAAVSGIVLFVAIANVATLLLLRAARRRREVAVRLALGAGRGRLVRQLLIEGWLLASLGAVAALLVAHWVSDLVRLTLLPNMAASERFIDPGVLAPTLIGAIVAGLVAGLAPLAQTRRPDIAAELRSGRSASGRFGVQRALIAVQVALCTMLLVAAGLFVRSLQRVEQQDLGYQTAGLLVATLEFQGALPSEERDRIYTDAAQRLTSMPGVRGATVVQAMPFGNFSVPPISVPGRAEPPSVGGQLPFMYAATPSYLSLMGVRLRAGRLFTEADRRGSPYVVLVNETMARALWPQESAIGKCIRLGFDLSVAEPSPLAPATLPCREIVGVVADSRVRSIQATGNEGRLMQYYVPFGQQPDPPFHGAAKVSGLLIGATGDPARLTSAVERFLQGSAERPVYARVQLYEDLLDPQIRPWRTGATLFSSLGILALLIAAVGLFAVVSYLVAQRWREIGIRLALGATRLRIVAFVIDGALRMVVVGAAAGLAASFALAPLMRTLLFETTMHDVGVLISVGVVLILVAIAASVVPAWRASRVSPGVTLQAE